MSTYEIPSAKIGDSFTVEFDPTYAEESLRGDMRYGVTVTGVWEDGSLDVVSPDHPEDPACLIGWTLLASEFTNGYVWNVEEG